MQKVLANEGLAVAHTFEAAPEDYDASSQHRARFWLLYLRLGFFVLAAESATALSYFALTLSRQNRLALISISSAAILVAIVGFMSSRQISMSRFRRPAAIAFIVFSELALAVASWLDGGIDSPMIYLLGLPILFGALALTPRQLGICGVATVASVVAVALNDVDVSRSRFDLEMFCASVGGAIILALGMATASTGFERSQDRLLAEVARLTGSDPLTGCLNQRAFHERLEVEINRSLRYGYPLSLMVADVDLFKRFNDAHGHTAGDAALAKVARVLLDAVAAGDTVARIGGDEFAIILPETPANRAYGPSSLQSAITSAEGIGATLGAHNAIGVTLSIGIAELNIADPTERRIFRDADEALFRAKAAGRQQFQVSAADRIAANDLALAALQNATANTPEDVARTEERLREELRHSSEMRSVFDVLRSSAPVELGFMDRDFRVLQLNDFLARVNGSPLESQLGRTVEEMVPELWPKIQASYHRVLDTGKTVTLPEISGETAADPGNLHYWSSSLYPVKLDGEILGIGVVVIDVTDRKLLEDNQRTMTRTVIAALGATVEKRDPYTSGHQRHVAEISVAIAKEIGCEPELAEQIELAASIHELGKVAIPAEILTRPGALNAEETALIRGHSRIGFEILRGVGFPGPIPEMILQHHERLDGSGYPDGLRGGQIEIGARVIAVADVVVAIASRRPYRAAFGSEIALKEIQAGSGTLFDASVVTACLKLAEEGRIRLGTGDAGA